MTIRTTGPRPPRSSPGRPRSDAVTDRVRAAARVAFAQQGFAAVTMADIAGSAGVGMDSIYRRWPSKQALLVDVVAAAVTHDVAVPDTGSIRTDLRELLTALARAVDADLGLLLTAAIAESVRDPQLAQQLATAQERRRAATVVVVDRAVARGELRSDAETDVLLDALAGLVWQRLWLSSTRLSKAEVIRVVDALLRGFVSAR